MTEIDTFGLLWRSKRTLALGAAVGAALGLIYFSLSPNSTTFSASSSIVVRDLQTISEPIAIRPERFVANQVQMLRSFAVASRAAEILAGVADVLPLSAQELMESSFILDQEESDLIFVTVRSEDEATAIAGANALVEAFRAVSGEELDVASQSALARIDAQLESIDERLASLTAEMAVIRSQDAILARLQAQMESALVRIADLQDELAATSDDEDRGEIEETIASLRSSVAIYQEASTARGQPSASAALSVEQQQLINRRALLLERQDSISIETALAPDAIDFSSPATFALPDSGLDLGRALGVGLVLGLLASAGVVVFLASGRGIIDDKLVPEAILGTPLLAEIPEFGAEHGIETTLPMRDAPRSASAEAFRFAATSLEKVLKESGAKSLLVTSSTIGHGKTVVTANILLAVARRGFGVLAIDADFGNQELTSTLTGNPGVGERGITEVLASDLALEDALTHVYLAPDVGFDLLSRGSHVSVATDMLRQPKAHSLFRTLAESNDLVVVDGPPFLQVAYATTLSSYVDGVVVVVAHKSRRRELLDLANRLRLAGAKVVGYVYNLAPLSEDMSSTEGSLKDVLGDRGFLPEAPVRTRA